MGSASIAEDQCENSMSNMVLQTGDQNSLDLGTKSVKSVHLNDQLTSGDDYAPKARKPYTITKQRERWTEEEHKKFLEALKLYGRAWRRIEEHVGTKTAVQIRSHAQKFFSKVVRESNSGDAAEVKPIEIPPPRPKRKPMHPYPRKLTSPHKMETHLCEQPPRSNSPNSSASEQENHSPTSVLSVVCSDTFAMTDSCSPNGSSSPVSSAAGVKPSGFLPSEDMSPDENGFSSLVQEQDSSVPDEQVPMKLELFREDNAFVQEGLPEVASTQSLKLFGKTVLVTDSHRPSTLTAGTCKSLLTDASEVRPVQTVPWNLMPMNFSQSNSCSWSALPCGPPVYYMQFLNENSDSLQAGSSVPWWSLYGGLSCPFPQPHNPETQEKELQKEGSLTGSNTGSGNSGGESDKNWDVDTQSGRHFLEKEDKEQKMPFLFKQSEGSAFSDLRAKEGKCRKGFVPYKRCLAERDTHSSITGEEREEQRVRLCL